MRMDIGEEACDQNYREHHGGKFGAQQLSFKESKFEKLCDNFGRLICVVSAQERRRVILNLRQHDVYRFFTRECLVKRLNPALNSVLHCTCTVIVFRREYVSRSKTICVYYDVESSRYEIEQYVDRPLFNNLNRYSIRNQSCTQILSCRHWYPAYDMS